MRSAGTTRWYYEAELRPCIDPGRDPEERPSISLPLGRNTASTTEWRSEPNASINWIATSSVSQPTRSPVDSTKSLLNKITSLSFVSNVDIYQWGILENATIGLRPYDSFFHFGQILGMRRGSKTGREGGGGKSLSSRQVTTRRQLNPQRQSTGSDFTLRIIKMKKLQ